MRVRGTTLRKLEAAATAKRADEWERFSNLYSFVIASGFSGKWIDPRTLNPFHEPDDEAPTSDELRAVQTQMGFDMLREHLGQMAQRARAN